MFMYLAYLLANSKGLQLLNWLVNECPVLKQNKALKYPQTNLRIIERFVEMLVYWKVYILSALIAGWCAVEQKYADESKKPWSSLYSKLLYKMGKGFLDI